MRLALLAICACTSQGAPQDALAPATRGGELPPIATAAAPAPAQARPQVRRAIQSPPAGELQIIAATSDGSAAVTVDVLGAIRVWPALEGTREPFVVTGPSVGQIAIARDGDGYAVAIVDHAGTLVLARSTGEGDQLAPVQAADDQPVVAVLGVSDGFVVLRADCAIDKLDPHGTRGGRWQPLPGERVIDLATVGGRVLAFVEIAGATRGRWLDRWDDLLPVLALDRGNLALSPDGRRAVTGAPGAELNVIDLATARRTAVINCTFALGYTDADVFACQNSDGKIEWWSDRGTRLAVAPVGAFDTEVIQFEGHSVREGFEHYAVAGHTLIASHLDQLVILGPHAVQYLGYRDAGYLAVLRDTPLGVTIDSGSPIDEGNGRSVDPGAVLVLDDELRVARELHRADTSPVVANDIEPIGGDRALALRAYEESRSYALYDVRRAERLASSDLNVLEQTIQFEPATQLIGGVTDRHTVDATEVAVERVEGSKFGEPSTLAVKALADRELERVGLALVDPALAGGALAIVTSEGFSPRAIRVFEIDRAEPGQPMHVRKEYVLHGSPMGVDRAGRFFTYDGRDVVVSREGAELVRIPYDSTPVVVAKADGTAFAFLGGGQIAVYEADGRLRWQTAVWNASAAAWHGDTLVVAAGGLVALAGSDGHVVAERCGWRFGLWPRPLPIRSQTALACDAP